MELYTVILISFAVLQLSYLILRQPMPKIKQPRVYSRPVFVDTSALMDGRILSAAQTGFIPSNLVVPNSVIAELQLLADASDNDRRARARKGLDIIAQLQAIEGVQIEIMEDGPVGPGGVDERLRELAKAHDGSICTIDYNLNKVAKVEGIFTLNINELAGSIRMAYLPGEKITLELIQKGNDGHQAVGYLPDGTMVVVDKAANDIGSKIEVEFIRSLQTAAGRMMFAKKATKPRKATSQTRKPKNSKEDSLIELVNNQ